ncbi:MAG TPA: hypothetical protein VMJ32_15645 [Pirellulales bacterium]|nr:hypothetical protein [Pirellulales bacterium]
MPYNIFSTYAIGENRVTASILAVLQSLSLERMTRIIGALFERPEFELVSFKNQVSGGADGIPDAEISSSCRLLIETKIKQNALDLEQLKRHVSRFKDTKEATKLLLILTPDDRTPDVINEFSPEIVTWASFVKLHQAIEELLNDRTEIISEREAFLLKELQVMLDREDLISSAKDVVVVAARRAWPDYQRNHAYVCQPGRQFQRTDRMAFYANNQIYQLVPRILDVHDPVEFIPDRHGEKLDNLIKKIIQETPQRKNEQHKVVFLSAPDSPDTVILSKPIPNDLKTKTGRAAAYTMGQRYTTTILLQKAKSTSDLDVDDE